MNTMRLVTLAAMAALAMACGRANDSADAAAGHTQTFNEAAGELAHDVAADVSAAGEQAAETAADAGRDATEAAKKDAAAAIEEGIRTE